MVSLYCDTCTALVSNCCKIRSTHRIKFGKSLKHKNATCTNGMIGLEEILRCSKTRMEVGPIAERSCVLTFFKVLIGCTVFTGIGSLCAVYGYTVYGECFQVLKKLNRDPESRSLS